VSAYLNIFRPSYNLLRRGVVRDCRQRWVLVTVGATVKALHAP
jgi:hypothetical protein